MMPAKNDRINEITDIIKEKLTTGKDFTSLTSPISSPPPLIGNNIMGLML